jgi:hypothetical protein
MNTMVPGLAGSKLSIQAQLRRWLNELPSVFSSRLFRIHLHSRQRVIDLDVSTHAGHLFRLSRVAVGSDIYSPSLGLSPLMR